MFMEEIDYFYVMDFVKTFKPKIGSGFQGISSKRIKETTSSTTRPLTHIIKTSLNTGFVHDKLKSAEVCPVFKTSDADELNNYRPISLLSTLSKILEKILYKKSFGLPKTLIYKSISIPYETFYNSSRHVPP